MFLGPVQQPLLPGCACRQHTGISGIAAAQPGPAEASWAAAAAAAVAEVDGAIDGDAAAASSTPAVAPPAAAAGAAAGDRQQAGGHPPLGRHPSLQRQLSQRTQLQQRHLGRQRSRRIAQAAAALGANRGAHISLGAALEGLAALLPSSGEPQIHVRCKFVPFTRQEAHAAAAVGAPGGAEELRQLGLTGSAVPALLRRWGLAGCAVAPVAVPPTVLIAALQVTLMPARLCLRQPCPSGSILPPSCSGVLSIYIEKAEGLSARMHDAGFTRNM